jgi:hypothetical protein
MGMAPRATFADEKSRRTLDPQTARKMVRVREARRAYLRFRTSCFWSYRHDVHIGLEDVEWVADTLMKNGNLEAWKVGRSLKSGPSPQD